jgi:2-amino-4-hydroxy-6-hydroxymethyldihydropteridine diphosphokinase
MTRVFIGIGSNVGDRRGYIELARHELAALRCTALVKFSSVIETAPVGPVRQGAYLNAAAELNTTLDPFDLLDGLAAIEVKAGREPRKARVKWGPRTLDLDILLFGDRVISHDELVVPHPMLHERWFVLKPLAELDADVVHPVLEMGVGELLKEVEAKQKGSPV